MPEFLHLLPPQEALQNLLDHLTMSIPAEEIETAQAVGRVSAKALVAPHPLPMFPRSTVDGYAVRAKDTHGASESLPAYFTVTGEVPMGSAPEIVLDTGQCALVHTGGMLPENADGVVMLEHTQMISDTEIEIMRAIAESENVLKPGEDVKEGEEILKAGVRLRPAEIGGLMALGITRLKVAAKPTVGILSTGDEVLPPDKTPLPGQVRDINSYTLKALVERAGGTPVLLGIVSDRKEMLRESVWQALETCDMVVVTAGSSASVRDLTAEVINELGQPGVLVHGVNVRPGKPTILGVCNGKPVIGLPGNPVSALVIAGLFVTPILKTLEGERDRRPSSMMNAEVTVNLASQAGREDWIPVRLVTDGHRNRAEPIFGKSNLIFSLARADGLLRIPPDATGVEMGDLVEVYLL